MLIISPIILKNTNQIKFNTIIFNLYRSMKKIIISCLTCLVCYNALANVELPSIFGDNMVLQQKSKVAIWGKANTNKTIKILTSWDMHTYTTTSNDTGYWKTFIQTPAAGGPYTIAFNDGKTTELHNILIGEVWVCSGQSNMEMPMKGYGNQPVLNSNDILVEANNLSLRLFHVQRAVSNTPQNNCVGSWEVSSPESASTFSAVGFQFAKRLQEFLKVPIGIIESNWGGTPIEAWMNKESLSPFTNVKVPQPNDTAKADRLKPTCLFNGMINPIAGYAIKGFLWYQGETNVPHPTGYDELMKSMVEGWRKLWQQDSLSFYYVQIAPWNYGAKKDSVPYLREAQQKAASKISFSGMAVSIDKGNEFTIHPPDKTTISNRLLYWALGNTYHIKGIAYHSPYYEKIKTQKDTIAVSFTNTPNGFTSDHKDIVGFEIAGSDHIFHPATAKIVKNTIEVHSTNVHQPVAVRYCFTDFIEGNLYNTEGLPVAPFRTDDWK